MNHNEIKQRLLEAESAEAAAVIARESGQELTAEQADRLFQEIRQHKAMLEKPEELDAKELETVTGGYDNFRLAGICKGSIEANGWCCDSKGKIYYFTTSSWCWFGSDYCSFATETYDDYKVDPS